MEQETPQPIQEPQPKISTPAAIIIAGVLIMAGILVSNSKPKETVAKTLSEQVGISKEKMTQCIKDTDVDTLNKNINDSVDKAMVKVGQRGTPYSVIIGKNGVKTEILGADTYENVKKLVSDAKEGIIAKKYEGAIPLPTKEDHVLGNPQASVTIIEYSDFECPYCKQFHPVLKRIVTESNGDVRWIYRNYPLHQHSFEKLVAAECVAKLKGPDAYWKYSDLLFGLLKTGNDSVSDQL